jgi:lysophospholipase L1-like esterase
MTRPRATLLIIAALTFIGCGSSTEMNAGGGGSGGTGGGGAGGSGGGGAGGGGGGGGGGGTGTGGNGTGIVPPTSTIGTFITLGDSISDSGGEKPFYHELLKADFTAKWPGVTYVHGAQNGAITDVYSDLGTGFPVLKTQVTNLGHTYPGDVLVVITIGGNDLNGHAAKAIGGTDTMVRGEFGTHLDAALGELATAGRLGTGKVYIVLANIYDFTDGMGDFAKVMCGPAANVTPARDLEVFKAWNDVAAASAQKVGGTIYDMYADFHGHGYNNMTPTDVWFLRNGQDCIHPNAKGHDSIRRSIYTLVTGSALP